MKHVFFLSFLLAIVTPFFCSGAESEGLPAGSQLLDDMRAQLPREPIVINGLLEVRKRKGIVTRTLNVEMRLDLGHNPAKAKYILRDALGKDLEQMSVIRGSDGPARFEYAAGNPLAPAKVPDLFQPFQDTDVSWMELTLSFLWWPGGKTLKAETLRGQDCFIVEVDAPTGETGQYKKVRLWVDEKLHMVLQAEGYDVRGELVRRLFMKSFKKIEDRWMVKDMDIQCFPSEHRTNLRVETMRVEKN